MNLKLAKAFAARCPDWRPRVWVKGEKCRVYLSYPTNRGTHGGGDMGWVDFSGPTARWQTSLAPAESAELRGNLEAALEEVH